MREASSACPARPVLYPDVAAGAVQAVRDVRRARGLAAGEGAVEPCPRKGVQPGGLRGGDEIRRASRPDGALACPVRDAAWAVWAGRPAGLRAAGRGTALWESPEAPSRSAERVRAEEQALFSSWEKPPAATRGRLSAQVTVRTQGRSVRRARPAPGGRADVWDALCFARAFARRRSVGARRGVPVCARPAAAPCQTPPKRRREMRRASDPERSAAAFSVRRAFDFGSAVLRQRFGAVRRPAFARADGSPAAPSRNSRAPDASPAGVDSFWAAAPWSSQDWPQNHSFPCGCQTKITIQVL